MYSEPIVCLSDTLKIFISELNLKFSYGSITIDFMDYFPKLLEGRAFHSTVADIIYIYVGINAVSPHELNNFKLLGRNIDDYKWHMGKISKVISSHLYCYHNNNTDIKNLDVERLAAYDLRNTVYYWVTNTPDRSDSNNPHNELCQILLSMKSNDDLLSRLLIRRDVEVLYKIITGDDMYFQRKNHVKHYEKYCDFKLYNLAWSCEQHNISYLFKSNKEDPRKNCLFIEIFKFFKIIDEFQIYHHNIHHKILERIDKLRNETIGNGVLQLDFIYKGLTNSTFPYQPEIISIISSKIKQICIEKYWCIKQLLINNFEKLIGQSNVANDIIYILYKIC